MIDALAILILAALFVYREYLHTQERQELLNRIQAPEVVVQRQVLEQVELPEPVPVDMGPWAQPQPQEEEDNG